MVIARTKAFVILDGTLLPIDPIAADTPYYSGKHKRHGMNVQVLADPFGRLLWASPALPGTAHDLTATRQHGITASLSPSRGPAPAAGRRRWWWASETRKRPSPTQDDASMPVQTDPGPDAQRIPVLPPEAQR